jgi:hypothetical protein
MRRPRTSPSTLLAENAESSYVAYVSQQNLVADEREPIDHPAIGTLFEGFDGRYKLKLNTATSKNRPRRLTEQTPIGGTLSRAGLHAALVPARSISDGK